MSLGQDLFLTYWTFYSLRWKSFFFFLLILVLKVFAVGKVSFMKEVKRGIQVCQTEAWPFTFADIPPKEMEDLCTSEKQIIRAEICLRFTSHLCSAASALWQNYSMLYFLNVCLVKEKKACHALWMCSFAVQRTFPTCSSSEGILGYITPFHPVCQKPHQSLNDLFST